MKYIFMAMMVLTLGCALGAQEFDNAPAFEGTKATLSLKDKPLEEILAALTVATGNPTRAEPAELGKRRMDLEIRDVDYWEAIRMLCERGNLTCETSNRPKGIVITEKPGKGAMPMSINPGGCMTRVLETFCFFSETYQRDPARMISLQMIVQCEPKANLIKISNDPIDFKAMDPDLKPLKSDKVGLFEPPGSVRDYSPQDPLTLNYFRPEKGIQSLISVIGKFGGIIETKSEDWVFQDLSKAAGQVKKCCDKDELTILSMRQETKRIITDIEIKNLKGKREGFLSGKMLSSRLTVECESGVVQNTLDSRSLIQLNDDKGVLRIRIVSSSPSNENLNIKRVVIRLPSEIQIVQIPFEFPRLDLR